jgi:TonB family protein
MFKTLFIALSMLSVANPTSAETETPVAINVESATFCNNNMNAFSDWVSDRLVYPEESKKYGSEGIVNVMFSVDENGRVINVKVTKPYDKLLDAEAVRVVSMSPRWKPMRINGKGVMSNYTLDVNFKLTK